MQVLALALAASVASADGGVALVQTTSKPSERPEAEREDGRRAVRRLPANLGRGIVGVLHQDAIIPLAIGAAAAVGASALDHRVRDSIDSSPGQGTRVTLWWPVPRVAGVPAAGSSGMLAP